MRGHVASIPTRSANQHESPGIVPGEGWGAAPGIAQATESSRMLLSRSLSVSAWTSAELEPCGSR